ncbi:MAG: hypothetical protein PHG06_20265 [Parabacteroides sp.]|nr:hypothetical protein [Parabacteroides sp.]
MKRRNFFYLQEGSEKDCMGINKWQSSSPWPPKSGIAVNRSRQIKNPFNKNYTSSQIMQPETCKNNETNTIVGLNQTPVGDNQAVWKLDSIPKVSVAVEPGRSELEKSTNGECQMVNQTLESEVGLEMDMDVQNRIQVLEERVLQLESEIQRLMKKSKKRGNTRVEGGIITSSCGCCNTRSVEEHK